MHNSAKEPLDTLSDTLEKRHPGRRGTLLAAFASLVYSRATGEYFSRYPKDHLEAAVVSMFEFLEGNPSDSFAIRVHSPPWLVSRGRGRTAIEVTGPDQPFLVDSLRELIRAHGHVPVELFHPIVKLERGPSGDVVSVRPHTDGPPLVSFCHLEIDRALSSEELTLLDQEAAIVFAEVRQVAHDFLPMLERLGGVTSRLKAQAEGATERDVRQQLLEYAEFLQWLQRGNFVFLGYRGYSVVTRPRGQVAALDRGSGLGILRDERHSPLYVPRRLEKLAPDLSERLTGREILTVRKTGHESRVLRRTRMDDIGVKKLGEGGEICGEHRFLGLFTARALGDLPAEIPILRRKLDAIIQKARVVAGSHDHKEIFSIFCSFPKSELFVTDVESLYDIVLSVLEHRDRLDVRVSYRADALERGISVMVLIPKERFSEENRQAIEGLLTEKLGGTLVDYHLVLSDEPQARMHFYFATPPGHHPAPSLDALEFEISALTRSWDQRVRDVVTKVHGAEKATELAERYAGAFPASYRAQESPETAAADIADLEAALAQGDPRVIVGPGRTSQRSEVTQIKVFRPSGFFHLSQLMPVLNNLGLEVWDELTYRIQRARATSDYIHSFRVLDPKGRAISPGDASRRLEETILQVLRGNITDDRLNSLILLSQLTWRQVDLLRAYTAYFRQLGGALRQRTAYRALCRHPDAAVAVVALFEARFDPDIEIGARENRQDAARREFEAALEEVPGIHDDQILRGYDNLVQSTTRTNYFQRGDRGELRPAIALKVRSGDVARMPEPRPLYEIFVANPRTEGIHLRGGMVARGGIRWSDRVDDYRTEVLGLMKAQRTKNALIVPVGAKGGFVLKRSPTTAELADEVRRQYEVFIGSLLDLTDNVVDGAVLHPDRTVAYDGDDPYLVVAADRGTAQFSDFANDLASRRSFWLGDAFASGGSTGYSHKAHGITARGAWESVKRHFLELGIDPQTEEFTVAGIGDMSGDVFGNGMLQSRKIRLLAAFNHRHVFLDPSPEPEVSYVERERVFHLPGSSWIDFDRSRISPGGGVFDRTAKSIRLSDEAKEMLGLGKSLVNGDELVRAILAMPVDLLWNGGIGTYVKGTTESHLEVGDPTNDAVRVDAAQVRARAIGEGGNLGITQSGRVEYARKGGKVNTDFIDNSGGVDLSDREVNLKILLGGAVKDGKLTPQERNELLKAVAPEVCDKVLRDNYLQCLILSIEEGRSAENMDQLRSVIDDLESRGLLDRAVEGVPKGAEIRKLREAKKGLCRPQLAVILAYVKIDAYLRVLPREISEGAELGRFLDDYFPRSVVERFAARIRSHPLHRELASTVAVNECVNRMGLTFLHRLERDSGVGVEEVLKAYLAAANFVAAPAFYQVLDALHASRQVAYGELYEKQREFGREAERITRWFLRRPRTGVDVGELRVGPLRELGGGEAPRRTEAPVPAATVATWLREIENHLTRARGGVSQLEASELARETAVSQVEAVRAIEAAGTRLLVEQVADAMSHVVRSSASEWRMCDALEDRMRGIQRRLAELILKRKRDLGAEGEGAGDALDRLSRELVPDGQPRRRRIESQLALLSARGPATPSELFVAVEDQQRLLDEAIGGRPTARSF